MRLTKAYIQVGFIAVIYVSYYFTHDMQLKLSSWVDSFWWIAFVELEHASFWNDPCKQQLLAA